MSDLRKHLALREHRELFPFILLCRACWEYIINEQEWRDLHATKRCIQQTGLSNKQIRGPGVCGQWHRLYDRMFPQSQRIPSPCMYAYFILLLRSLMSIIDVDDPTSIPKASSSHIVHSKPSPQDPGGNFNFNDPYSIISSSQDVFFGQNSATSHPMPAQLHSNSDQSPRTTFLEPIPADDSHRHPTFQTQLPNNNQAFLDYSLATAQNTILPASGLSHAPIRSGEIAATEPQHFSNHDDGFSFYFPDTLNLEPNALQQEPPSTDICLHEFGVQPQLQGNTFDRFRTATQQFIHEQLEEVLKRTDSEGGRTIAQRIARINAENRADCEALADELMARINALAEQRRSRSPSLSGIRIAASSAAHDPTTSTVNATSRDGQYSASTPGLLEDLLPLPIGSWEEDLYNPATLDDMGTLFWDIPPDPTHRSFFPDLDLTLPPSVPT
jgi:hypothetical protein